MKSLGMDRLSEDDRLRIAEEIWRDIADDSAPVELTDAQKRDLERRIAEDDANPDAGISWEAFDAKLRGKS